MIVSRAELRTIPLDDSPAPSPTAALIKQSLSRMPAPYLEALRQNGAVARVALGDKHVTFSFAGTDQLVFCAVDNRALVTLEKTASMLRGVSKRATVPEVASDTPMGTLAGKPIFKDRLYGGRGLAGAMLQQKLHALWDEAGAGLAALRGAAAQAAARPEQERMVAEAAVVGATALIAAVSRQLLAASTPAPRDPFDRGTIDA